MNKADITVAVHRYAEEALHKSFVPGKTYIPPSSPKLYPVDIETLVRCALDLWFTEWRYAEMFKDALSDYVGFNPKVTLCNSGSSASLLAISAACEFFNRDKKYIVTCATTFPTTVTPIYLNGKIPFYIDIDPLTLQPNMDQLAYVVERYRDDVCGVFLGHNLGFPFDEAEVGNLLYSDQWFIADCCDALGARTNEYHVGVSADLSILSFFPAHHITCGEGGAVLCSDPELHALVESLSNWGRSCYCKPGQQNTCGHRFEWDDLGGLPEGWDHKYVFDRPGFNLKMTDLQAALGLSQLGHIDEFVRDRRRNYEQLWSWIFGHHYVDLIPLPQEASPFGFPILVREDAPFTAQQMIDYLEKHRVGTRRVFAGNITKQPGFENKPYESVDDLSGSDRVMRDMFWVSVSPALTEGMIDYMISTINDFLEI